MKNLSFKATAAEMYAEAARVALARQQWNIDHPDVTPMPADDWLAKAEKAEHIFCKLAEGENLDADECDYITAEIEATPKATPTALAEFNSHIDEKVEGGMARHAAARSVAHAAPELHKRVIAEANA